MSMRIGLKALKKLPVVTKSGQHLGYVSDCIVNVESQQIIQYVVSSGVISKEEHIISRDQIANITEEKIEVYDTAITNKEKSVDKMLPHLQKPEGVALRE